ncbi:MAG: hypothetical protein GY835_05635 [bacterium]|nr:hypothetical protein [bacterium]
MSRYAENTTVSIEKSKGEIEQTLRRYGADQFMSGWDQEQAMIGFVMEGRHVRFILPMPSRSDFEQTDTGRERNPSAIDKHWEQAQRSSWRALNLVIKAKLESVDAGIFTFEQEFLPHILLPNGQTVGDFMTPQIESAYSIGQMPALLPAEHGGGE